MKKILVGLLMIGSLTTFAQMHDFSEGKVAMVRTQAEAGDGIDERLQISGDVANKIFDQLISGSISQSFIAKTCEGQEVKVEVRKGKRIECQSWPKNCSGTICTMTLDTIRGDVE